MLIQGHVPDDPQDVPLHLRAVLVKPVQPLQQLQATIGFDFIAVRSDLEQQGSVGSIHGAQST